MTINHSYSAQTNFHFTECNNLKKLLFLNCHDKSDSEKIDIHISFNHCIIVIPATDAWADKAIAPIDAHITTVLFYMPLILEREENQGLYVHVIRTPIYSIHLVLFLYIL